MRASYTEARSGMCVFVPIRAAMVSSLARTCPKDLRTLKTLRSHRTGLSGKTTRSERWSPIARAMLPLRSIRQTNGIRHDCSHPRTSIYSFALVTP